MSISDMLAIDAEIAKIEEIAGGLAFKKRTFDTELSAINGRIRSGGRLPQQEYAGHCRRQTWLKQQILDIEKLLGPLKAEKVRWRLLREEINVESGMPFKSHNREQNPAVREEIVKLRSRYLSFAEDHTRVNSMRLMAGEFASELTRILGSK
jgi:hypothetical protein